MGWLKRIFGQDKPKSSQGRQTTVQSAQRSAAPQAAQPMQATSRNTSTQQESEIPPERLGLNGEYDQSGLAKRVALAFDEDPQLDDVETLWVAQTGSTVVLKGKVPDQQMLTKMVSVARGVRGATAVDTDQVAIA